jgi:hypothetical protein
MSWFMVGAAVVAGVSAIAGADSQRRAAHAQADIARQKGKVAMQQANVNEDAQRRRADMILGAQRAAMGQAGTGLDGTNADLYQQSATNAELDALNIRYGGELGETSAEQQARLDDMQASDAQQAGYLNAGAAALSSYGGYKRGQVKLTGTGG